MKIRIGFVSNSSSSSFAIAKKFLTPEQIEKISYHAIAGEEMGMEWARSDEWTIRSTEDIIGGETWMDNFDMHSFLTKIGVPMDKVEWSESPCGLMLDDIVMPMMKEEQRNFVEMLELEVASYPGDKIELEKFVKWVKEGN